MKTYAELMNHVLLEREQDSEMRSVAMMAFERCKKQILVAMEKAVERAARFIVQTGGKMPSEPQAAYEYRRDTMSNLVHGMREVGNKYMDGNFGYSAVSFASKGGEWGSGSKYGAIMFLDTDGKNLFLPSSIKKSDFAKRFPVTQKTAKYIVRMTSERSNYSGTYSGNRETGLSPKITLYNMTSLDPAQDMNLDAFVNSAVEARAKGGTKAAVIRPLNQWMDMFIKELERQRFTFVHEYIHMLDDSRYKSASSNPGNIGVGVASSWNDNDINKKQYYTSDAEFNAYFQGAAAQVEDAVRSFLIACTNEMAASRVVEMDPKFNQRSNKSKCNYIADTVVFDLHRVMEGLMKEGWAEDSLKQIQSPQGNSPVLRICIAAIYWYARKTSEFFLQDPKKRKKLLNRAYSMSLDINKIIADYRSKMSNAEVPTVQEFNRAREKFRPTNKMNAQNAYALFYSGLMMGKKPFDPNTTYTPA
jgi:hypothetical protein